MDMCHTRWPKSGNDVPQVQGFAFRVRDRDVHNLVEVVLVVDIVLVRVRGVLDHGLLGTHNGAVTAVVVLAVVGAARAQALRRPGDVGHIDLTGVGPEDVEDDLESTSPR